MRIGLIDVDGHHFPNLALMRISAYHKAQGDTVEWWWSDFIHYDIVYKSKVFSDAYTPDVPDPMNADKVIKGGTGYQIHLVDGKEVYDKETDTQLPPEMERMFPDYSIYPQYNFAVSMTSRGCPRGCAFCHVAAKEGRCSVKVADVSDFWCGQKEIKVLDPNITACREKRDLLRQYRETKALIDFTQGLDIRLLNDEDIRDLNYMRLKNVHFAWDNAEDDLEDKFSMYALQTAHKPHGNYGTVYVLTNFNSTMEENLYRIYTLRNLGFAPLCEFMTSPMRRGKFGCYSVGAITRLSLIAARNLRTMTRREDERTMTDLISRAALFNACANLHDKGEIFAAIQNAPTVDAVVVVRCKECVEADEEALPDGVLWCNYLGCAMLGEQYCNHGNRKGDNDD